MADTEYKYTPSDDEAGTPETLLQKLMREQSELEAKRQSPAGSEPAGTITDQDEAKKIAADKFKHEAFMAKSEAGTLAASRGDYRLKEQITATTIIPDGDMPDLGNNEKTLSDFRKDFIDKLK